MSRALFRLVELPDKAKLPQRTGPSGAEKHSGHVYLEAQDTRNLHAT